jgi:hypothetical protein
MKKKLICAFIGLGIGIGSFSSVAGSNCSSVRSWCLSQGNSSNYCAMVYADCKGY